MSGCCPPPPDLPDAVRAPTDDSAPPAHTSPRLPTPSGRAADHDWVSLPGGTFQMGGNDPDAFPGDGEGPIRAVTVAPFAIAATAVTNAQFRAFVRATGHVSDADRAGWSYVFHSMVTPEGRTRVIGRAGEAPWWSAVRGATWSRPRGPGSSIHAILDHPVVHVSWRDAAAYCTWSGTRLPTEAEWEYAAHGGLDGARFPWGDALEPDGQHCSNVWQGAFPNHNDGADGWVGTAPVRTYNANGFGLFQMTGNVWEWCADRFSPTWHNRPDAPRDNPRGPNEGTARVIKGGSFLCHASYCNRYRIAARSSNTPDSSTAHMGFRVVADLS